MGLFSSLVQKARNKKVLKELDRMQAEGEILRCDFCGRWRLSDTDCDCMEPS